MEEVKKYTTDNLSAEELDTLSRTLLRAHKNQQRKTKWEEILASEHHTVRASERRLRLSQWGWPLAVAASICLAMTLYFTMPSFSPQTTPDQLATVFLTEVMPPASGNIRKGEGRQTGSEYFDLKAYDKAIPVFETTIQEGQATENAPLLLGISFLYEQQPSRALEILTAFETDNKTAAKKYNDILRWYLSIANIQTGQYEKAKDQLYQLKPGDWQYEKAQDWIQKLSK